MFHPVFKNCASLQLNHCSHSKRLWYHCQYISVQAEGCRHLVGTFVNIDLFTYTVSKTSCRCGVEEQMTSWTNASSPLNYMQLSRNKPLVLSAAQQNKSTGKVLKYGTWHDPTLFFQGLGIHYAILLALYEIEWDFTISIIWKDKQSAEWPWCRLLFYLCLLKEASTSPVYRPSIQKDRAYTILADFYVGRKQESNNKCHSSRGLFCNGQMDLRDSDILVCLQPLTMTDKIFIKKMSYNTSNCCHISEKLKINFCSLLFEVFFS